jgi:hypothetical protein
MILLCIVLSACGGKKEGDKPPTTDEPKKPTVTSGHCMVKIGDRPEQICWEFADRPDAARSMCQKHGFVENQLCPKANLLATCRGTSMVTRYYSGSRGACSTCPDGKMPEWNATSIAQECKEAGGKLE